MQNRSACFKITFKSNVTIKGRGVGHHFGLCQRGAKGLIDKGKTYKEVLSFYYPKTYIETYENFSKKVNDDTL